MVRFIAILGIAYVAVTGARSIAQAQDEASLREVFPETSHFLAIKNGEEIVYYKAEDRDGKMLGVVFKVVAKGYQGNIETLVGMFKDGTINTIKVLPQNETPGLGARVAEFNFTDQFKNVKDFDQIQAIAGATISSTAVIDSVKKKAGEIRQLMKEGAE